jgi:hypothetical protein
MIDFLVPRKGNAETHPVPLTALNLNAHAMRFMTMLFEHVIVVRTNGMTLRLPHPVHFAFHKLLVSSRREEAGKRDKDRRQGIEVLDAALAHGDEPVARQLYSELPRSQRSVIRRELERAGVQPSFIGD